MCYACKCVKCGRFHVHGFQGHGMPEVIYLMSSMLLSVEEEVQCVFCGSVECFGRSRSFIIQWSMLSMCQDPKFMKQFSDNCKGARDSNCGRDC